MIEILPFLKSKTFLSNLSDPVLETLIKASKTMQYAGGSVITQPQTFQELMFIVEGEVKLMDARNPKIEVMTLVPGRSLELGTLFKNGPKWEYQWYAGSDVTIISIPFVPLAEELKKDQLYFDYLIKMALNVEVQKFNKVLKSVELDHSARIEVISKLKLVPIEEALQDWTQKVFLLFPLGRLNMSTRVNGVVMQFGTFLGGDHAVLDMQSQDLQIDVIEGGKAWCLKQADWEAFENKEATSDYFRNYDTYRGELRSGLEAAEKTKILATQPNYIDSVYTQPAHPSVIILEKKRKFDFSRFVDFLISKRFLFLGLICAGICATTIMASTKLMNKYIFDRLIFSSDEFHIIVSFVVIFSLGLVSTLYQFHIDRIIRFQNVQFELKLFTDLVAKFRSIFVRNGQSEDGFFYSKVFSLLMTHRSLIEMIQRFILDSFSLVIAISVLWITKPILAALAVVMIFFVFGIWGVFYSLMKRSFLEKLNAKMVEQKSFVEVLGRVGEIKSLQVYPTIQSWWRMILNFESHIMMKFQLISTMYMTIIQFALEVCGAVLLYIVARDYALRELSYGVVVTIPYLTDLLTGQVMSLASGAQTAVQQKVMADEVDIRAMSESSNYEVDATFNPRVSVRNLQFSYTVDKQVHHLKNVQFDVSPGEKIVVVGSSGSGKSTLLKLMRGDLKADGGDVMYGASSIMNMTEKNIFNHICYIPQDPFLYSGTLLENITGSNTEVSIEQVQEIVRFLDLEETVTKLPNSYSTFLNYFSTPFSDGQKQRIALARVLFQTPHLLLLDDPTSYLDAPSEIKIIRKILSTFEGRTVIYSTQRLNLVHMFDRIVFLKEGEIVEMGTHKELIAKRSFYYEYFSQRVLKS